MLSVSRRVGKAVPFLVMTSPYTDQDTRDFFAVNDHFGLDPEQVRFFCQGTVPSLDESGRLAIWSRILAYQPGWPWRLFHRIGNQYLTG